MKIRQCLSLRFPLCNLTPGPFKPAPLESSWDSSLTLWRSKLCGKANFAVGPLSESSTSSCFYLHMTVKFNASHAFTLQAEQFQ
jgi:hypothetical protein